MHQAEMNNVDAALQALQLALSRSDDIEGTLDGDDLQEARDRLMAVLRRNRACAGHEPET